MKGARQGEAHHFAKLTDARVREARHAYKAGGVSFLELAGRYDVDLKTIRQAVNGQTWGHVQ